MTDAVGTTWLITAVGATHHVRRGGAHFVGLIILVIIIAVVVVLVVQRRRDRRLPDAAVPPLSASTSAAVSPATSTAADSALPGAESPRVERATAPREPRMLPAGHYSMTALLRSEWTKLRTVRSTMWTLGVTIFLGIGLSVLACAETRAHWSSMSPISRDTFDPTSVSLIGVLIGEFAVGILGALVMSAEYGTGTIRSTFAAAPRRPRVLAAKATVFGFTILVITEVVAFLAYFVGQALLSAPAIHTTLSSPGALRAVVGSGVYLCLLGLLALGLATIIRHTAGAVSAFIGVLLVLPIIVAVLPSSLSLDIRRYLPDRIGASVISLHNGADLFSPWNGLLVLAAYAVIALIVGGVMLVRRDA